MLLRQRVSAVIYDTSPEHIWDFASHPKNWTASNPVEHRGLELFTKSGRPETGVVYFKTYLEAASGASHVEVSVPQLALSASPAARTTGIVVG